MFVHLNGNKLDFNEDMTVRKLLIHYDIDVTKVAVERNMEIISEDDYDVFLEEGDVIEIVYFIGGG